MYITYAIYIAYIMYITYAIYSLYHVYNICYIYSLYHVYNICYRFGIILKILQFSVNISETTPCWCRFLSTINIYNKQGTFWHINFKFLLYRSSSVRFLEKACIFHVFAVFGDYFKNRTWKSYFLTIFIICISLRRF